MAYLTNTVYVQSLEDLEAMDLHSRYQELLKAYEEVLKARSDDRKAFEQQVISRVKKCKSMYTAAALGQTPQATHELVCTQICAMRMVVGTEGSRSSRCHVSVYN